MPSLDFDTSDVLRRIMAPAADDVTQLRVHREGRGLGGKRCYAYIAMWCRVNNDRVSTQVKNCAAFVDLQQHGSTNTGHTSLAIAMSARATLIATPVLALWARFTCAVTG